MERPTPADRIRRAIVSKYPVIHVVTPEEDRAERTLQQMAATLFSRPVEFVSWSATTGLVQDGTEIEGTREPLAALEQVLKRTEPGLYLFKDLHPFFARDPAVVRRIRDAYYALRDRSRFLFLLSPSLAVPSDLRKEVAVVDFDLPAPAELRALLDGALQRVEKAGQVAVRLSDEERVALLTALQGLTLSEARHALARAFSGRTEIDASVVRTVNEEKEQISRKEGVLEFISQRTRVEEIGGLENLKEWLFRREPLFRDPTPEAQALAPRGLLMMGISGCGKSLSVKAIATLWNLPLFRLDMNQVFSGAYGSPEEAFARALRTTEVLSPCILWIDEIEMGCAGYQEGQAGPNARIFAAFLTWMQEKSAQIFVAATANRIDLLPAEVLRKGRFDQIFFVDLPSEKEREEIFRVHLEKRGVDLSKIDLTVLSKSTKNWNGAEIEQCVVSALVEAYTDRRSVTDTDLFVQIGKFVPLATTMAEQIKHLRSWAYERAVKANR